MNEWDRVSRRLGKNSMKQLASCTVAVIGCGSLGSHLAVDLAMSSIRKFVLVDKEVLEADNWCRHAADRSYVGWQKTEAVADLIRKRIDNAKITCINDDVRKHIDALRKVDLAVVCGLGSEVTTTAVARQLRQVGIPSLFAGLYDLGVAGECFLVDPKNGPCYACFASELHEVGNDIVDHTVNYGAPVDEVKAVPGLGIHADRLATIQCDWAIRFLTNGASLELYPKNLVIFANETFVVGQDRQGKDIVMQPLSSFWKTIKRNPKCLECGGNKSVDKPVSLDELL